MFSELFPIVTVRDMDRALRFYGEAMGGKQTYRFPSDGAPQYVGLRVGATDLGIAAADAAFAGGSAAVELCIYADDCDSAVERLRAAGATILAEPEDQPWGERMARVADPESNRIVLLSRLPSAPEATAPATPAPRSAEERKRDTLARLERDTDIWVSSADEAGNAYVVPLSYLWDGRTLTMATPESGRTGRNLAAARQVRLALGVTRDVVLIMGTVEAFTRETVPAELADAFAAKLWDARKGSTRYGFYRVTPREIQAWREENELVGRHIMRDGAWLT
jgi:predicted enzyme related to lactoylglutathione lyase